MPNGRDRFGIHGLIKGTCSVSRSWNEKLAVLRSSDFNYLRDKRILEVGCGHGQWLREFIKWGACPDNMTGIDVLPNRVAKARQLCPQGVQIHCGNAARLSFGDAGFDLVFQFTVFSSILDMKMKETLAREMIRVLKEDGLILWYDLSFNNPRNSDVCGIGKREIGHLFPDCHIDIHRISLAPPLSRLLAPYSWLGCYLLEQLKVLNTHNLGVIRRN